MERISTGIEVLDSILQGGIPAGASVLVAGNPGTGKTILSSQIVFKNASPENKVLYLTTMSEPQAKVIKFQQEFTYFDIDKFQSSVFFYDLASLLRTEGIKKVLTYLDDLITKHQPKIVVIDTLKVFGGIIETEFKMREFLLDLSMKLAVCECTSLFIGEYREAEINMRPESAIVDGIMYLSGTEEKKYQKRYLRILKMRGTNYEQGEIFFKITENGLELYPRLNPNVKEKQAYLRDYSKRIQSGIARLDEMMGGGIPESTVTLVSGAAGTGKTVLAIHFAYNGLLRGEPVIYTMYEENPMQLVSSALSIGIDLEPYISTGQLQLIHTSPVELDMDEHVFQIQDSMSKMGAKRLIIDSISSFELGILDKIKYTDYIYSLTNYCKTIGVTALLTHEMHNSFQISEFTKHGVSFVADNLITLQYKETEFEIKRFIRVVKSRSSAHDMNLREMKITDKGLIIKDGKS